MRDWRSAIVTVTVRDQRYREHDPILGVVSLKLSDILKTSSQVTRWYPLEGGIGFGRIRISLLFRSVEMKLAPNMLGWDVGTFEITSDRITAKNYPHQAKIRLRTGGSTGRIPRSVCHREDGGSYFDLSQGSKVRLPVRCRYRSPVVFELHVANKRGAAAYAVLWLQHLVDNEDTPIDLPIWTTKYGHRLTQNYITEQNWRELRLDTLQDLKEVGRLQFTARFSAGMDESHRRFVVDNNSRETYETWEACVAEGLRVREVSVEMPQVVQKSAEDSKRSDTSEEERRQEVQTSERGSEQGKTDEPAANPPVDQPERSNDDEARNNNQKNNHQDSPRSSESSNDNNTTTTSSSSSSSSSQQEPTPIRPLAGNKANKRSEHRKQRGMMQWKPVRNAVFARDEARFALHRVRKRIGMDELAGREPDVETETG